MQEQSLARQRRWLFKAQPVARQGSVSFRVKLTFAATDDQSQVSTAADVRYPNMSDRIQSQAGTRLALASVSSWPPVPSTAGRRRSRQVDANMPDAVARVGDSPNLDRGHRTVVAPGHAVASGSDGVKGESRQLLAAPKAQRLESKRHPLFRTFFVPPRKKHLASPPSA